MKEEKSFREETGQEQTQGENEHENRKTVWYGYIGAAAIALFIVIGIIWQASGKTISETAKELEARKKTENSGKKDESSKETVTDGAVLAAIDELMDEPVKTVTGAAIEANTKREELLAKQAAAAQAEEAARKKAEEEAKARAAEEKAGAEEKKAAQRAEEENFVWGEGDSSGETDYVLPEQEPAQPIEWNIFTDEVIRLVNIERANAGLSPLVKNEKLCQAAEKRASEIGISFSHTRPDGRACNTILEDMLRDTRQQLL